MLRAWRAWRAVLWVEREQQEVKRTEEDLRNENRREEKRVHYVNLWSFTASDRRTSCLPSFLQILDITLPLMDTDRQNNYMQFP